MSKGGMSWGEYLQLDALERAVLQRWCKDMNEEGTDESFFDGM